MMGSGRELGFGISVGMENNVSAPARDAARAVNDLGRTMDNVRENINKQSVDIDAILKKNTAAIDRGNATMSMGVGLIGAGMASLVPVGLGVKFAGELEMAQIGFTTLLGSADLAKKTIDQLRKDAAATPFEFGGILSANRALIAATGSADHARTTFMALGNVTSAFGQGEDVMVRMAQNMQGIRSTGKATMMDIRQFTNTGIPLWDLMSEATGKSVAELKKMDITFDLIDAALQKAGGAGGKYANAMNDMSMSISGKFSTLSDEVKSALAEIGFAVMPIVHPLIDFITNIARGIGVLAKSPIGKVIIGITLATSALLVVMGGLLVTMGFMSTIAPRLSTAFIRMGATEIGATFATGGLTAGMGALATATWAALAPMLPYIAAGAALVAIGMLIINNMGVQGNAWEKLSSIVSGVTEVFRSWNGEVFELSKETHDSLEKNGILPWFLKISTYVVRAKEFFSAFFKGTMAGWSDVGDALGGVVDVFSTFMGIVTSLFPELGKATEGLNMFAMAGYMLSLPIRTLGWTLKGIVWILQEVVGWIAQTGWLVDGLRFFFTALLAPIYAIIEAWKLLIAGINYVMESKVGQYLLGQITPTGGNEAGGHNKGIVESDKIMGSFVDGGYGGLREKNMTSMEGRTKAGAPTVIDKSSTKTESIQLNVNLDSAPIHKQMVALDRQNDNRDNE